MNDVHESSKKSKFIDWLLKNHEVSTESAAWFLKKLISKHAQDKDAIKRVFFTNNIEGKKYAAVITSCDYEGKDGEDFACYYDGEPATYRAMIQFFLATNENLYIKFRFKNYKQCEALNDILEDNRESLESIMVDIMLKMMMAQSELDVLNIGIDNALRDKKKRVFNKLSKRIKEIKEENPLL